MPAWGIAPGLQLHRERALKARVNESRFQRWRFCVARIPGAMPQAGVSAAPLALNTCRLDQSPLPMDDAVFTQQRSTSATLQA